MSENGDTDLILGEINPNDVSSLTAEEFVEIMRRKRRKKHRRHREVEEEKFHEDIFSRKRRETFNLDVKLRFKLCEDPNGDPLTPGTSEFYLTSGYHFRSGFQWSHSLQ